MQSYNTHGKEMSISGLFVHTESEYYLHLEWKDNGVLLMFQCVSRGQHCNDYGDWSMNRVTGRVVGN